VSGVGHAVSRIRTVQQRQVASSNIVVLICCIRSHSSYSGCTTTRLLLVDLTRAVNLYLVCQIG
jgi:hypothetical protein